MNHERTLPVQGQGGLRPDTTGHSRHWVHRVRRGPSWRRAAVERSGELATVRAVEGVIDRHWTPDLPAPVGLVVPDLTPEGVHEGDYLVSA